LHDSFTYSHTCVNKGVNDVWEEEVLHPRNFYGLAKGKEGKGGHGPKKGGVGVLTSISRHPGRRAWPLKKEIMFLRMAGIERSKKGSTLNFGWKGGGNLVRFSSFLNKEKKNQEEKKKERMKEMIGFLLSIGQKRRKGGENYAKRKTSLFSPFGLIPSDVRIKREELIEEKKEGRAAKSKGEQRRGRNDH